MPAVRAVCDALRPEMPFRDVSLLVRMHGFNSVMRSIGAMTNLGLDASNVFWFQKANTSAPTEAYGLGSRPIIGDLPSKFPYILKAESAIGYEHVVDAAAYERFLDVVALDLVIEATRPQQLRPRGNRLALIEDGAYFASACLRQGMHPDAGCEQTARGRRELQRLNVDFPVTDVATWKATHEGPVIGFDIVNKLLRRIEVNGLDRERALSNTLIIGGGPVGRWVARCLADIGTHASIDEQDAIRAAELASDLRTEAHVVLPSERRDAWKQATCVIECVGAPVLRGIDSWPFGKSTVLCEASSDNWGFDGILRGLWGSRVLWPPEVMDRRNGGMFWQRLRTFGSDVWVEHVDGRALVLNGGMTINFDGSAEPTPPRLMQGVRAAMVAGLAQALRPGAPPGLLAFDPVMGELIMEAGGNDLAQLVTGSPSEIFGHIRSVYRSSDFGLTLG